METALEASFYVLAAIFSLGMLMVLVLFKDVFFHGRFTVVLPPLQRVPTTGLNAVRDLLKALKAAYARAQGERQEEIGHEIRHLEHRISALEDKTYVDQADYYDALKAREKIWREWRSVHEEARLGGRSRRMALRSQLDDWRRKFSHVDREVHEEFQRAVARDSLTLEELKKQGVLEPAVLYPPQSKKPVDPEANEKDEDGPEEDSAKPGSKEDEREEEAGSEQEQEHRVSKWPTALAPYPPAMVGVLRQGDLIRPEVQKSERTYVEEHMSLEGIPGRMLQGENFNLSSFAEVVWRGIHRYVNCTFIGTDLRRIELLPVEGVHLFQDCDFKGASLAQSRMSQVIFRRCNLSNTHWRGARLDRVKFEGCRTENVHWEGVDLSRSAVSEDMALSGDYSKAGKPPRNVEGSASEPVPEQTSSTPSNRQNARGSRDPGQTESSNRPDPGSQEVGTESRAPGRPSLSATPSATPSAPANTPPSTVVTASGAEKSAEE